MTRLDFHGSVAEGDLNILMKTAKKYMHPKFLIVLKNLSFHLHGQRCGYAPIKMAISRLPELMIMIENNTYTILIGAITVNRKNLTGC